MIKVAAPSLNSAVDVLSTMITPAVLIMACGSLILTTSTRLIRAVDRVREIAPELEKLAADESGDDRTEQKRTVMFEQLDRATTRARLLQRALTQLYASLSFFVATSAALGAVAFTGINAAWLPLLLGLIGAVLLLSASLLLIFESRVALAATLAEMDYVRRISHHHASLERRERRPDGQLP